MLSTAFLPRRRTLHASVQGIFARQKCSWSVERPSKLVREGYPGDELSEWSEIVYPEGDATTYLPEFRYEWGDFMALSYNWGGFADAREIFVNGQPLTITQNAEACLKALRRKQYIKDGWKLWIDAVCINQKDIVERASQVKRMREIYTRAWTPIIWLGEEETDSDAALSLMATLASEFSSADGVSQLTNALHQNPQRFGSGCWRGLNGIICRVYWTRLWILQEAALGRSSTPVLCGDRTISWILFARSFSLLINSDEVINTYIANELKEASIPFDIQMWSNLYVVNEIQSLQTIQLQGKRPNLYRLLCLSRRAFSTNPRDKIYGLLGIMDENLAKLVQPDYADTVRNVYSSFTLAIINATGSLDMVRHAVPDSNSSFPSWVPDWTVDQHPTTIALDDTSFAASGSSVASIRTLSDEQLLSCKGIIVDRFDGLGTMWSEGWAPDSIIPTRGMADPYNTIEAARDAIWTSLVAGRRLPSEPLNADYGLLLATPALAETDLPENSPLKDVIASNVFSWCVKFLKNNAGFVVAGRRLDQYFWKKAEPEKIDAVHLRDALMQRDRIGLQRRLITTERGYVGMALEKIEEGDVIAVLLGCSMPMVLRKIPGNPKPSRWQVVGECYIHGIMDGESMKWGLEVDDIVLC